MWWYDVDRPLADQAGPNTLYAHVFGDFGTAAMPGVWDRFFRCVKAMATLEGVLTLPMPHYVDDNSLIGPNMDLVNAEAINLGNYMSAIGVPFKDLKSRTAAMVQLVLGFWWDSGMRTRTLEKEKLEAYLSMLRDASRRRVLTLHELQVLIGRVHRAVMTMTPGATIFLARLISMTCGLRMPWHRMTQLLYSPLDQVDLRGLPVLARRLLFSWVPSPSLPLRTQQMASLEPLLNWCSRPAYHR